MMSRFAHSFTSVSSSSFRLLTEGCRFEPYLRRQLRSCAMFAQAASKGPDHEAGDLEEPALNT
jgi:hypothetical protein